MWILALINVSGIVRRFWVRVHEIGHIEIKAYKINHLSFIINISVVFRLYLGVARRFWQRHLVALHFSGFYWNLEIFRFKSSKSAHFIDYFFGISVTMLKRSESVHFIVHFTLRILTNTRDAILGVFEKAITFLLSTLLLNWCNDFFLYRICPRLIFVTYFRCIGHVYIFETWVKFFILFSYR